MLNIIIPGNRVPRSKVAEEQGPCVCWIFGFSVGRKGSELTEGTENLLNIPLSNTAHLCPDSRTRVSMAENVIREGLKNISSVN